MPLLCLPTYFRFFRFFVSLFFTLVYFILYYLFNYFGFLCVSFSLFQCIGVYSWRMYVVLVIAQPNGMTLYYCCLSGTTQLPVS